MTVGGTARRALACALAVAVAGCSGDRPPAQSAVLITVDTWRADRLGAGGHPTVRTPHFDRFFRRATQYADAISPIPTTLASHASILSGEWPTGHGVPRNGWPLPDHVRTLPEILEPLGFATGAFVSSTALHPSFGLSQGFGVYDYETPHAVARDQDWRGAEDTLARAREWWDAHPGRRFLWVHLFEPHFPYDPAPEDVALYDTGYRGVADGSMDFLFAMWEDPDLLTAGARDHLESLYHAEITGLDRKVGSFLRRLENEEGDVIVVIVGDHGESLGEHGLRFKHGLLVHPADVSVPLAIGGVAPFGSGLSGALVRTIDLIGTLLDRLAVPAELPADAGNLVRERGGAAERPSFAEASMPWNVEEPGTYPNYYKQRAIRTKEWAYVETPYRRDRAWYRRGTDPAELDPVEGPLGEDRERLTRALQEWIARGRARPAPTTVDPSLVDRLRSLGYIE